MCRVCGLGGEELLKAHQLPKANDLLTRVTRRIYADCRASVQVKYELLGRGLSGQALDMRK
jgi:hypothetical protein